MISRNHRSSRRLRLRQSCRRSELAAAQIGANSYGYAYDSIGNRQWFSANGVTNGYAANCLNQYSSVEQSTFNIQPTYDSDGNLTSDGAFNYAFDAENRLVSAYPTSPVGDSLSVENRYDHKHRRVRKIVKSYSGGSWKTTATHTFVWDDMNIVLEQIAFADDSIRTVEYFWGNDLSGTVQGAGGVGGLLYLTVDGAVYIPCYDNNGNIMRYLDISGNVVAEYTYDAFGRTILQSGTLADVFRHRFSSKYFDMETGLYYYGYRFYGPKLKRWLTYDPLAEDGGLNLYAFCENAGSFRFDRLGLAFFAIRGLGGLKNPVRFDGGLTFLDDWLNRKNLQVAHEQLFFQDGGTPCSVGYGKEPLNGEKLEGYVITSGGYDDCIMRLAVAEVDRVRPPYSMLGIFDSKYNCQDYASALRAKYAELVGTKEARCKCKKGGR